MTNQRYRELLEAERRIRACGCGGACAPCQREPRASEEEEFEMLAEAAGEETV